MVKKKNTNYIETRVNFYKIVSWDYGFMLVLYCALLYLFLQLHSLYVLLYFYKRKNQLQKKMQCEILILLAILPQFFCVIIFVL